MKIALAMGANLGESPSENIRWGALRLMEAGVEELQMAPLFRTKPVDCVPGTPDFINTAVVGQWNGTPLELLAACQQIEREAGRPAVHSSHEARLLDIDILLLGTETLSLSGLIVPHPRMHLRRFVLEPLATIAPDWIVPPFNKTVMQLLKNL
ncbi:MAG: 2-amino-4-hydroxy-6-hydroxymethyldihydropteridine diphosphokinase [Lentisphaeria bacterium]|nr:2-amino-4-hydroxy-6-hydroxymethyldihydropteridine diphosphokinase [Lentisphaeria bacterium]